MTPIAYVLLAIIAWLVVVMWVQYENPDAPISTTVLIPLLLIRGILYYFLITLPKSLFTDKV